MANRLQFSIRFLLVATLAVAAGVGAVRAAPSWQVALAMDALTAAFLTAAIIGTAQTRGASRAFWIGTGVVLIAAFHGASENTRVVLSYLIAYPEWWDGVPPNVGGLMPSGIEDGRFLWVLWCAAPINGILAVLLYWLFATNRKPPA